MPCQMDGNMSDIVVVDKKKSKHYYYFNKCNGLSIRAEYPGEEEPFWAEEGPELLDISITNYCEKGCSFCYRNSSVKGKHMSLEDYESILKQLKNTHTYQIAIGGGNPNQHPDFVELLRMTKQDYGIIPSYTTNGTGLSERIISASKLYCGAVAVSYYEPIEDFIQAITKLKEAEVKTNIHFLLTPESIDAAIGLLENPPVYLQGINAVVFLNYKPVGNNSENKMLLKNSPLISQFFEKVKIHDLRKFKIGFDSCSVSGIVDHLNFNPKFIESCESGRFSAFISEKMKLYPCSFMENLTEGIDLKTESLLSSWKSSNDFVAIRNIIRMSPCKDECLFERYCSGGCPIFNDINLCIQNKSTDANKDGV